MNILEKIQKIKTNKNFVLILPLVIILVGIVIFLIGDYIYYLYFDPLSIDNFSCNELSNQQEVLKSIDNNDSNYKSLTDYLDKNNLSMVVVNGKSECPQKYYLQISYKTLDDRLKILSYLNNQKLFGIPTELRPK